MLPDPNAAPAVTITKTTADDAPPTAPKSVFTSKTAVVNFVISVAGIVGFFEPHTSQFVHDHATAIISDIGILNVILRFITHGRIYLFGSDS